MKNNIEYQRTEIGKYVFWEYWDEHTKYWYEIPDYGIEMSLEFEYQGSLKDNI